MMTVSKYMSPVPLTIRSGDSLARAHQLMRQYGIRHLPVLEGDQLAGVVSERDLYFIDRFDPEAVSVSEAMTAEPFTVAPTADLGEVVRKMADARHGSAVVVEDGVVVGIFTTVDALEALADLLGRRS
jgi:acetoin utilization protein AcuB